MIEITRGNILEADVEAVINTVNTVGHMGKGIALQFKKAYPENYEAYRKACKKEEVQPGRMFIYDRQTFENPKYIINFPTKRHWRGNSRMEDIESGLEALLKDVQELGVRSVAVPPLGAGLGGLIWVEVLRRLESAFTKMEGVRWIIYEPKGAPPAMAMDNRTKRPRMTKGRAAVLGLINRYLVPGFDYPVSLLEFQKLIYFLKAAGEDFQRVEFVAHHYGPYADTLRHVLSAMDGHFITGYGDGRNSPETPINLQEDAVKEAEIFLENHPETRERFDKVADLIEGFETPYGMELLATVHWVTTKNKPKVNGPEEALQIIKKWSTRKATLMKLEHVKIAWEQLKHQGWFELKA